MRIKGFNGLGDFIPPFLCMADDGGTPDTGGGGQSASPSTPSDSSGTSAGADSGASSPPGQPTATPSTTTPSSPSPSAPSREFDFMSMFEPASPEPGPKTEPPVAPVTASSEVRPAATPATPASAAAQTPPVVPQPGQQQAPGTSDPSTAPGGAPRFDPTDPTSVANGLGAIQDVATDHIAKTMFQLSPQEIEGLETNAAETIPRLLSRVFIAAQQQYLLQMSRMVPAMIQRQTAASETYRKNGDAFFKAWPQLNERDHGEVVARVGRVWRQQNPQASLEQAIAEIGPMAMMIAKVPAAPAATPAKQNGRAASPSPAFQPAQSGATSMNDPTQVNPYEFLGQQG